MARRGDSSSIILLLVCLIVLVGGVTAGYIAIDKKIIENPFASLLQGEPITPPSSEPLSVPATSTEETDFFMKTDRPKPGAAPFFLDTEKLNLLPGTTINCKRYPFSGDTNSTLYKYIGGAEVKRYPNTDVAESWGVSLTSSTPINCKGLTKGADMKGNWSDGQAIKCGDTHYSGDTADTLYRYAGNNTLRKYPNTAIATTWGATSATAKSDNCGSYTKGDDMLGNWPTGTTVKCSANDKLESTGTRYYYYINPGTLMAYETKQASEYYWPLDKAYNYIYTPETKEIIPDCTNYAFDSSYTIFDPRPNLVGDIKKNGLYTMNVDGNLCYRSYDNVSCKTSTPSQWWGVYPDTTGQFNDYPFLIYNNDWSKFCASDANNSHTFRCNQDDFNTPGNTGRTWERFNIEPYGNNTYVIKAKESGKYCGLDGSSILRCNVDDKNSAAKFAFNYQMDVSGGDKLTMPENLPLLNTVNVNSTVKCKAFPPVGGNIDTYYKYVGDNTIKPYVDEETAKSWDSTTPQSVNCMGAKKGDTISYGLYEDKMADVKAAVSAAIEEGSKPSTPAPAPGSPVNCVGGWIAGTQYTERAPSGKCWQISGLTGAPSRKLDRTLQPEKYIITTQPQSGGAACPHENAAKRTKVISYDITCGGPSRTGNQSSPAVNGYIT